MATPEKKLVVIVKGQQEGIVGRVVQDLSGLPRKKKPKVSERNNGMVEIQYSDTRKGWYWPSALRDGSAHEQAFEKAQKRGELYKLKVETSSSDDDAEGDDAEGVDDAAYGGTPLSAKLLRVAGRVSGHMKDDPAGVIMAYSGDEGLASVDDLVDHFELVAVTVKPAICGDSQIAFSALVSALCRLNDSNQPCLKKLIPRLNSELFDQVDGARWDALRDTTISHLELLKMLRTICERYKAEYKQRNSSMYEKALEVLEEAQQLSPDVKAQWVARGKLYDKIGVLASCVNVKMFNDDFLETSFDKTLHLPAGGLDLSFGDFTPHLAAEPGPASRLALLKFAQVPTRCPPLIIRISASWKRRRDAVDATQSTGSFHAGVWLTRGDY